MPVTVKGVTCNSLHVSCDSDEFEDGERYAGSRNFKIFQTPGPGIASLLLHCRALRLDLRREEYFQPWRPADEVRLHRHLQVLEP